MLEIFIGMIAGIVGGLGMGGGTVLILLLSLLLDIEQHIAQATNVIFFVPTAIAAIYVSFKNRNINLKVGIPVVMWGCLGAFIGASISTKMNLGYLRKCFGIFLIFIAIYQLAGYIKEKKRHTNEKSKKGGEV